MNINTEDIQDHTTLNTLCGVIDTLATGATFGERALLEKFGFVRQGDLRNDSHFVGDGGSGHSMVKFSTGGSQPYWLLTLDSYPTEHHILNGYPYHEEKFDSAKFQIYLDGISEKLKSFDFNDTPAEE